MRLHIVIPVVNEADQLRRLLPYLLDELNGRGSITVADGGSTDDTEEVVRRSGRVGYLACAATGRGRQMNEAAALHDDPDDVYYFVHADTRPPRGFYTDIRRSVADGSPMGCYRFRFDSENPLLAVNAFFTRFGGLACRGGDQSLFVARSAWEQLGGFDADMDIMEDYDIIQRARRLQLPFRVIPRAIVVSDRKYHANGWLRVQWANLRLFRMYQRGAPQREMVETYRRMLKLR
ncbi:rSAM/selenodomain-associated transferase 2 [Neolewinella xylanilytica]|uniref:RSAM/selenodomain-associated transferase 2 n=1 Tax=Neolewinella xylanilytica TaxID=1514080 RepID=A0A2S6I2R9_9BACT|nr:TIGR04283 family arsenosugar biosynthesis glycosyltransferase [Neolewinella xylanilytica]PPK85440.1 rSAM/selenodomain-associated transferase 2 [Neolewinella xylanilytica]